MTGGARGLGLAVALSFAREGCSGVAIIDVLPDDILAASKAEIEAAGARCLALKCDVTKEDQIEQAVAATVKEFGRLDYAAYVDRTTSSRFQTDPGEIATQLV